MKRVLFVALICLLFTPLITITAQDTAEVDDAWWQERVWYLLFVRSFYDSDGDGIGDIRGVIEKLDYLNDGDPNTDDDLGIGGIWLLPVAESNAYHGYWTTDFYSVETDYGTEADFRELIAEAEARGMRVVIDFVGNHVSTEHPWFQAAVTGDPEFEDWFIWSDENPGYSGPWGERTWWQNSENGRWYYSPFDDDLADLNHNNPAVTAEIREVARYWVEEMGVHGLRIDAAKYWIEDEVDGRPILEDAPVHRQYMAEFTDYVNSLEGDAITIAEIFDSTAVIARYVEDESFNVSFDFELAIGSGGSGGIINTAILGNKRNVERQLPNILRTYEQRELATFTTNHDLPRLLTQLGEDEGANRVVANMLLTMPGTPFLYYGEEIGMLGSNQAQGDEYVRTPMQWDATDGGGFTNGTPWFRLNEDFSTRNVAAQTDDDTSLLSHYRELIHLRNEHQALQTGATFPLDSTYRSVWGYVRHTEDETLLVVMNLDDRESREYTITLEEGPLSVVSSVEVIYATSDITPAMPQVNDAGGFIEYVPIEAPLPPYSLYVLRLNF